MPLCNMSDRLPCFVCCVPGTIHGRFFEVQAGYKSSVNSGKKTVLPFEAGYLCVYTMYVSFEYAFVIVWALGGNHKLFGESKTEQNQNIERFHSRDQQLCKFIGTKESVCIRKVFNSPGLAWYTAVSLFLVHQYGRLFIVLRYTNMATVTSYENALSSVQQDSAHWTRTSSNLSWRQKFSISFKKCWTVRQSRKTIKLVSGAKRGFSKWRPFPVGIVVRKTERKKVHLGVGWIRCFLTILGRWIHFLHKFSW